MSKNRLRARFSAAYTAPCQKFQPAIGENAAVHGRPAGRISTTITAAGELTVDDDGDGIPAGERGAVLERFARGSTARGPGTGLGLAIAAAQAARHGGNLALGDAPSGGLRARVTFPVAAG